MEIKFKPLNNRVVILPDPSADKSAGGIILPDAAQKKEHRGTIVAFGPGRRNDKGELIPMSVTLNDRVLYGKYAGNEVTIDGVEYTIMDEDSVLGVLL